jgi:hypothetical protein
MHGPKRYLKKSISVGFSGIAGRRGSSPIKTSAFGFSFITVDSRAYNLGNPEV